MQIICSAIDTNRVVELTHLTKALHRSVTGHLSSNLFTQDCVHRYLPKCTRARLDEG